MPNFKAHYELACQLAREAGKLALQYWDKLEVAVTKEAQDIATNADLAIEDLLVKEIKKVYPEHNFLTEEHNSLDQKSDYTWVVDPIDGTKNYFRKIPIFCVAIALRYHGEEVLGVVFNPATNEFFGSYQGGGAYLNEQKLEVSSENSLDKAFLYVELPNSTKAPEIYAKMNASLQKLQPSCYKIRSLGSAELALAYVASGAFDAYVDLSLTTKDWDWAAGAALVREAEGVYRELAGGIRLGGNKKLLQAIEEILT